MESYEIDRDLYQEIADSGQDVKKFVDRAVKDALRTRPDLDSRHLCFLDEHCANQ